MKRNFPKFEITLPDLFVPEEAELPEYWLNTSNWLRKEQDYEFPFFSLVESEKPSEFIPVVDSTPYSVTTKKRLTDYRKQDLEQFNKMYDELGETDFREFLTKIAGLESRWLNNPKGNNTHSGLYQIKNTYLEHYTGIPGITKEQFVNNPKLQTKTALIMAKENYNQIIKDEALLKAASKKGYGVWELMAGAWLAGYKGMRRLFFTGREVGDANGTTITKRMNAYKNMLI